MISYQAINRLKTDLSNVIPKGFALGLSCFEAFNGFTLYPEELACLSPRASSKRRNDFHLGRAAAHEALLNIGLDGQAICKGANGAPLWPGDAIGSISHKDDVAVSVVAAAQTCRGLGVDLESVSTPMIKEVAGRICHDREMNWVLEQDSTTDLRLKMIFSAKEAIFKAMNPLTGDYFSFKEVRLVWVDEKQGFQVFFPERTQKKCFSNEQPFTVSCLITSHFIVSLFIIW